MKLLFTLVKMVLLGFEWSITELSRIWGGMDSHLRYTQKEFGRSLEQYLNFTEAMEEDPQLFQQFKGHKDAITASHFSPNGKQVMVMQLAIVDL